MSRPTLAGRGHVPRTMYKLTIAALTLACVGQAALTYRTLSMSSGSWVPGGVVDRAIWTIDAVWPFLLALCGLCWIPAALGRFFPEVNG